LSLTSESLSASFPLRLTSLYPQIRYNGMHVNEAHHVSRAFELLRSGDCNFLSQLSAAEWCQFHDLAAQVLCLLLNSEVLHGVWVGS